MVADALDSEYENGVADVLAHLAGDAAKVDRNVRMIGRKSSKQRQIDVRVTGSIFGYGDATMVVDCKRYKSPIDVNHVGTFASLVEDVGADFGLLVSTMGASSAALELASNVRGIRVSILSLDDLSRWSPRGTVHFDYAVPSHLHIEAARSARRAGFRVKTVEVPDWRGLTDHAGISAFRHLGDRSPSGESQAEARESLLRALRRVGVDEPIGMENGVVVNGGTPGHRWLEVTMDGQPTGLKILAASEEDIEQQLSALLTSALIVLPRDALDVQRPEIWPVPLMFPAWG